MINKMRSAAKINLAIDVLGKRPDGYHEVSMIMQTISLYDTIHASIEKDEIRVTTNSALIPTNRENIVYRAAEYLKKTYAIKTGAWLHIDKSIPVAAGLAGGSTDAAAALKLLNQLWDLRLNKNELMFAGMQLGADVPYCIQGGTVLAEGLGERLTPIKSLPECHILLAKPCAGLSTKEVYQGLDLNRIEKRPDIKAMLGAIEEGNLYKIAKQMCNVLEIVSIKKYPEIRQTKQKLLEYGAIGSLMSGSGPTVFGLFDEAAAAYKAYEKMKDTIQELYVVKTVNEAEA